MLLVPGQTQRGGTTLMETLSPYDNEDESAAPAAAAAAPVNARACASDEDNGNFWGKSNNLDLSKDPHPVNHGPSATLSDLGTFTRHPELTRRIGWFGKESTYFGQPGPKSLVLLLTRRRSLPKSH